MRRYRIFASIVLIFSVFGFVLAAPVAVQKVREASADAVDGGKNVMVGSGKRAEDPRALAEEEQPLLHAWAQEQAASAPSYWQSTPWRNLVPSSAPAPNYDYTNRIRPDPGSSFLPESNSGAKSIQPGVSTEIQPASLTKSMSMQPGVSTKIQPASLTKSVSFAPSMKVFQPSGKIDTEMLQPEEKSPQLSITGGTSLSSNPEGDAKLIQSGISTEIQPASLTKSVSFNPSKKVILPSGEIGSEVLQSEKKPPQLSITTGGGTATWKPEGEAKSIQPGASTEIQPASSMLRPGIKKPFTLTPLVVPTYHEPQMAAQQPPSLPKPQPSKSRFKNTFKKLLGKLKFRLSR